MPEIASVKYVGLPRPLLQEALTAGPGWRDLGYRILARSVEKCPVGKVADGKDAGKAHSGVHLKDTMECRFITGEDPRILIGSTLTRTNDVSALGIILEGTDAHPIDPHKPPNALAFTWKGEAVVFAHVNHPGTTKNPFVQDAMRAVCQETTAASAA